MGNVVSSGEVWWGGGRVPSAPLEALWSLYMAETAKCSRLCMNSSLLLPGIEHSDCGESQRTPGWEAGVWYWSICWACMQGAPASCWGQPRRKVRGPTFTSSALGSIYVKGRKTINMEYTLCARHRGSVLSYQWRNGRSKVWAHCIAMQVGGGEIKEETKNGLSPKFIVFLCHSMC